MKDKDLAKLIAQEMIEQADNKEITCLESYIMGFSKGLIKMVYHLMITIAEEAKNSNVEIPKEFSEIYEKLKNLENE